MTDEEACQIITVALAALPQQSAKMDDKAIAAASEAWAWLLEDISANDASMAVKRHLATSKWLPTPAEIRTIVSEAQHGRTRAGGDAWGDVVKLHSRFSLWKPPTAADVADPTVWECISSLGWNDLCRSENQIADRARFIELYDRLATERAQDRAVSRLPGIARPAMPGRVGATPIAGAVARALHSGVGDA